jgi:hypothetical protein
VRFAPPEGLRKIVAALTYHLKRLAQGAS